MIALASLIRWGPHLAAGAAALGALWWIDDRAYSSGVAAMRAEVAAEVARQTEGAQRAAMRSAARVAEIDAARRRAEQQQQEIADAVRDLDTGCLPPGVVRALGQVGGGP